ncbi:MAG: apolipoprotein N-acyltransferase [Acidobacteria bacterium]|nr:apolipoprotein N-acyltransferase [Acidobacteriota bacterium]
MTKQLLLACSSSLLLILIAPRWSLGWLAPFAILPLLMAVREQADWRKRALLGLVAGIPYWFVVCLWIEHVLAFHGGLPEWLAWISFVLFCFLKSLHMAVFAVLAGLFNRWQWWYAPAVAALWTGIERSHGTFGFAWLALGNAGIDAGWLLGVPALVGVYGLSFLFALIAAAIASRKYVYAGAALLWPVMVLPSEPAPPNQTAYLVQPAMPQASEWTRELLEQKLKALSDLSSTDKSNAPLLIWPEMPGPLYFDADPAFRNLTIDLARLYRRNFLFGTVTRAPSGAPYNTAILLNRDGVETGRYNKMNLVPFGEFVPSAFAWVNRITQEAGDFAPGDKIGVFPLDSAKLGVFICYESAFPEFVRQYSRDGAQVFANISNDGYFGPSRAREQHLSLVRMRAVENRRWILRATNNGITAVVDPLGRVTDSIPEYQHAAKAMRYGLRSDVTFYARHGDWFAWSCLAAALAAAAAAVTMKTSNAQRGH